MSNGNVIFEAKTDRELLVLIAQETNNNSEHLNKINSHIEKHDEQILQIMSNCPIFQKEVDCRASNNKLSKKQWAGIGGIVAMIIVILSGVADFIGKKLGLW